MRAQSAGSTRRQTPHTNGASKRDPTSFPVPTPDTDSCSDDDDNHTSLHPSELCTPSEMSLMTAQTSQMSQPASQMSQQASQMSQQASQISQQVSQISQPVSMGRGALGEPATPRTASSPGLMDLPHCERADSPQLCTPPRCCCAASACPPCRVSLMLSKKLHLLVSFVAYRRDVPILFLPKSKHFQGNHPDLDFGLASLTI